MAALEADRVVVELIAKLDRFDQPIKQSASSFEAGMSRIEASAARAETAIERKATKSAQALRTESAQISQFTRMLGAQINGVGDLMVSNKSPFVVPAKQAPAVANAMRLVSVGASALGGVLGGILVTATLSAVAAMVDFILKADDTEGAIAAVVEKLKEQARESEISRRAQEIFGSTIEGVTEALRLNEDALKKLDDADKSAARRALERAIMEKVKAEAIRVTTEALIDQARADVQIARLTAGGGDGGASWIARTEQELDRLEARLKQTGEQLIRADQQIQDALSRRVVENAETASDPLQAIREKYEGRRGLINQARERAIAEGTVSTELRKQIDALKALQREDEERARKRKARADDNRQTGRSLSEAEARAVVAGIGGQVTSGTRSPGHNAKVGGQANSFHLTGQALDIAKTAGVTLAKIRKAFVSAGAQIVELLDEGDHFHVAWRNKANEAAARAADQAKRAQLAEDNRRQAYENELAGLQGDEINARQALITSAEEIARLELSEIEVARRKYADNVAHLQATGRLRAEEAAELLRINDARAALRKELVQRREDERAFRLREEELRGTAEYQSAATNAQQELLQGQQGLARTQRERREIELQLLDLQFQEQRLRLKYLIDYAERVRVSGTATDEEKRAAAQAAEIARLQLGTIDQREAQARAGATKSTMTPLEALLDRMPQTAEEIDEAFEAIAANGLQALEDGIVDVITGARSLGDVFKQVADQIIADLVRIAIQKAIIEPLAKAVFGGGGGLFGGGISESGANVVTSSGNFQGWFADGGQVQGGRAAIVGERGPELFVPGQNGMIIPNNAMARLAGGRAGAAVVRVEVTEGALFEPRIRAVSGEVSVKVVRAAAPTLTRMASARTISEMGRSKL